MGRIKIVSNNKEVRADIQKEVNSFPDTDQISSVISHIGKKYGCNVEMLHPRARGGVRYVYCYFNA